MIEAILIIWAATLACQIPLMIYVVYFDIKSRRDLKAIIDSEK
jgi:hypothetical protein